MSEQRIAGLEEHITDLESRLAACEKERDEWKQICANRDQTVKQQGEEWVNPHNQNHQLKQDRDSMERDARVIVERLVWCVNTLDKLFTIGEKGGAFIGGTEYVGYEKQFNLNDNALSTPLASRLKQNAKEQEGV